MNELICKIFTDDKDYEQRYCWCQKSIDIYARQTLHSDSAAYGLTASINVMTIARPGMNDNTHSALTLYKKQCIPYDANFVSFHH